MRQLRTRLLVSLAVAIFFIAIFGGRIVFFLTEWMWFDSVGHEQVFLMVTYVRLAAGFGCGVIAGALIYVNARYALNHSQARPLILPVEVAGSPLGQWLESLTVGRVMFVVCALPAIALGANISMRWRDFLLFHTGGPFDFADPILKLDAGFYIFRLPVWILLRDLLWATTVLSFVIAASVYFMRGAITLGMKQVQGATVPDKLYVDKAAKGHLTLLGATMLALLAANAFLRRFSLLYAADNVKSNLFTGPGFADVYGTLPLLAIQSISILVAAVLIYYGLSRSRRRLLIAGAGLTLGSMALTVLIPLALQYFTVNPNQNVKEKPFIKNHIEATRRAYDLDRVKLRSLSGEARLTRRDIEANRATIQNIRLWDHEPLLDTFREVQEIRTYYEFGAVDNDRYRIDGELRQMMLSPRELLISGLREEAKTWINETLVYTHGYGVVMGTVNQVTDEGKPELFIENLPPQVLHAELEITRPEIYFGELINNPVVVGSETREFDYPSGETNAYTSYEGSSGVWIGSYIRRMLFALRLRSTKLLLANNIGPRARVMLYRNIVRRAQRIAPFLLFDNDPYMVIAEGKLYWILDAYTHASRFPYAERAPGLRSNYLRNSVKVIISAYDGTIDFYQSDPNDPIIRAWSVAFPNLIQPLAAMPDSLRVHLRYPEDYFSVQSELFTSYHMTNPQIFYEREDQWATPLIGQVPMRPYYTIMKLPGNQAKDAEEEFILMLPFTPLGRPNLAAWMVARSDGDAYGELIAYTFPKQKKVWGPRQIMALIDQDDEISPQITLWNTQGSQVIRGTLLVIPIEESLIYIQPLYLKAESGGIPELKRVILGYEDQIVMEPTLEGALARIFGGASAPGAKPHVRPSTPEPSAGPFQDLVRKARLHYNAAQDAARGGDWTRYGEEIRKLGDALKALDRKPGSAGDASEGRP